VIACLKESASERIVPKFRFIDVNAFQVTEPHQIYKLIYKELTDESVSAENAVMLLEKKFEAKSSEQIVLLVDELDMLCTKKQDVLYNIFDWPYKKNSKWIVIAIANAMNLPEQVMSKISSRLGMSRLIFQPYSHAELEEIVTLRLHELNVFDSDAITFAARKVAAVSGDARRALEICRRATELAERDNAEQAATETSKKLLSRINGNSQTLGGSSSNKNTLVSIGHVDAAIRSMFSSAKITALKHASRMEQLFMKAIACLYQASGIEETSLNKIYEQHT
jgi:origin recognition complex subunit 1